MKGLIILVRQAGTPRSKFCAKRKSDGALFTSTQIDGFAEDNPNKAALKKMSTATAIPRKKTSLPPGLDGWGRPLVVREPRLAFRPNMVVAGDLG